MNKRVYNGTIGKIIRTLGFLLVLVASVYLATILILNPAHADLPLIGNLVPFAQMADDLLSNVSFLNDTAYVYLSLTAGFILMLWVIRKGVILRVLLTVSLVAGFIFAAASGQTLLAPVVFTSPVWLSSALSSIDTLINQALALSEFVVPGVYVATGVFLWILFATKKPMRLSIFIFRLATLAIFVAMLMNIVSSQFMTDLVTVDLYMTVQISLYLVSYLLFLGGSVFGVVGFARK
ncbi:MAG: hypothetical protein IH571_05185 [Acholeplasmataceae bacterium]|nr:hypothetical protein [Acholeplasmataceae bacterium]